uniref:NADH-ubiquinone oxidoreductase chain 3 n=1 Tax=Stenopirates sp. NKU01 TaxID=1124183 RepID=A0A1D6UY41_9HEMI|nr:NADH dehydrogenase subunit 3 [Stenopirates sp. NKU01]
MIYMMLTLMMITMICIMIMTMSYIISKKKVMSREKMSPFECGFNPFNYSRIPFSLHFFMMSILFLIFDIEIIIIIPLIITINQMNMFIWLISISTIIIILIIGLIHEWKNGILEWTM